MISLSTNSSSQSEVSSNSCSTIPNFAKNSASDLARDASRKFAATDVPDRNNCFPNVCTAVDFGRAVNNRMILSANCLVRSLSPSIRIIQPIFHPLSAFGFPLYIVQPLASRTFTMVARMVFQVSCFSSMALGNMQPSQHM